MSLASPGPALRSEGGKLRRVAVVGAGVAGMATALELARARVPVDVLSLLPAKRAPSVASRGGVNAALDVNGEGDSPRQHFEDTIRVGESLAHQPLVSAMCEAAPDIVHLLDRMGVPFHRTGEGRPAARRLPGSSHARAAFAGATTGHAAVSALDQQLRRFEGEPCVDARGVEIPGEPLVRRLEHVELVGLVQDDAGVCVGVVTQDLRAMTVKATPYDAVVLATGGFAGLFAGGAASALSLGTAAAAAYRQGAVFANAELIEHHPTATHGHGRATIVSSAARSEGGRLWVPRDPKDLRAPRDIPERERDYFLERLYPSFGNLVAHDVAARAIHRLCVREGGGVRDPRSGESERAVYLDLVHRAARLEPGQLRGVVDVTTRLGAGDPLAGPVKVFPAASATLGGLWVDFEKGEAGRPVRGSPRNHATSVPGLYAVGEVEHQYHGAQRLPGNALLASIFGASLCAQAVASYRGAMARSAYDLPRSIFEKSEKQRADEYAAALAGPKGGGEPLSPYALLDELRAALADGCGVERDDDGLARAEAKLAELDERRAAVEVTDSSSRSNQAAALARALPDLIDLGRLVVACAKRRDESRGAHARASHDARDDGRHLAATLARRAPDGTPRFLDAVEYTCVGATVHVSAAIDTSVVGPLAREVPRPHGSGRVSAPPAKDREPKRPARAERGGADKKDRPAPEDEEA